MIVPVAYPLLAAIVKRSLKLGPDTIPRERQVIDAVVSGVSRPAWPTGGATSWATG